ncbi:MAG: TonB-dependent receptor, partial [Cytophagales bacterium]|nr:TonB-dependent receptor [Cytophagales bacterium]
MRKFLIGYVCWIIFSFSCIGQTIQLLDENEKPIDGVFIYHDLRESTALTNAKGKADISKFPKTGNFHFQHISFEDFSIAVDSLIKLNYILNMTGKLVWFNEVVVAANKWEQEEKDLSQTVKTVTRKEISFNNPPTTSDLLAQSGQVFVQKSQLGGGSPKLRGFSANSVLLVIDGVRMNNAIYRSGNLQNTINIDPNTLSSSEVVFGPGSVIYGSDALGGVMDFHTIDPRWSSDGLEIEGSGMARYGSASDEFTSHLNLSLKSKEWVYFGAITQTSFNDLKAGTKRNNQYSGYFLRPNFARRINGEDVLTKNSTPNVQLGSGYDLLNIIQKVKARIGKSSELVYGYYYSTTSNIPRYDRLVITKNNTDSLQNAKWEYGPQTWKMHSLRFNNYSRTKFYNQSRITIAFQDYEESRIDRDFGSDSLRNRTENLDLYSINLDFDKSIDNGHLFYGLEYAYNDVKSSAFIKNLLTRTMTATSTRYPDAGSSYQTIAIYGNWVKNLNPDWTLNLGSRFSFVRLKAKTENATLSDFDHIDLKNQALNGMIGLVHLPAEHTKISLTLSSGFRAPNIDDVGKIFEFDSDESNQQLIVIPNPNLKPEYSYNQELSYSRKFQNVTMSAVVFNTFLTNPIIRDVFELNGSGTLDIAGESYDIRSQVNGSRAHIYGGSLQMKAELSRVTQIYGTVSSSYGKESSTGEPLRHTTPVFGKVGMKMNGEKWKNEFYIDFSGNRWEKNIPSSEIDDKPYLYTDRGSPGWYTFNVKTSYKASTFL